MKRLTIAIALIAGLFSLALFGNVRPVASQDTRPAPENFHRTENPVADQYYVILRNDIRDAELEAVAQELASTYDGTVLRYFYETSLNGFAMEMKEVAALALCADARVEFVAEVDAVKPAIEESKNLPKEEIPITEDGIVDDKLIVPDKKPVDPEDEESPSSAPSPTPREIDPEEDFLAATAAIHQPGYILRRAADPRYFDYENKTIALVGMSASYLPHVARKRLPSWGTNGKNGYYDPVFENCTYDLVGGNVPGYTPPLPKRKFHVCVDQITAAGMNHMQIWVALNHSVGRLRNEGTDPRANVTSTSAPYDNEQPFKLTNGKWDLNTFDDQFFTNLKAVVKYCQDQGIVVGVVLFDPWSGWVNGQPRLGPWFSGNNSNVNAQGTVGLGFSDPKYFGRSDTTNPSTNFNTAGNPGSPIDLGEDNVKLRTIQVNLIKRTALELKDLKNFYWVLANEPDFRGEDNAIGQPLVTWLRYMSKSLWNYEDSLPGKPHHLIGVNATSNPVNITGYPGPNPLPAPGRTNQVISAMASDTKIYIITSHYVNLTKNVPKINNGDRFGGMELLRSFNTYTNGAPDGHNTKRWGFTEGASSGLAGWEDPPYSPNSNFKVFDNDFTAAHVRVEAWEFLLNGGAVFDHLAFRWGNIASTTGTAPYNSGGFAQANLARDQLGYLSNFLKSLNLDKMTRTMSNASTSWLNNPLPAYGQQSYWAAMSRPSESQHKQQFLFYFHRSTILLDDVKYEVWQAGGSNPKLSLSVKNLSGGINVERGCYRADWYYPSGKTPTGGAAQSGGTLTRVRSDKIEFPTHGSIGNLVSPVYVQDILLKITWVQAGACPAVLPSLSPGEETR